jgi:monoamine oxidase
VDDFTLDILKTGLESSRRLNVIVVGAGMAGLTAANLLQDAGHTVRVLEAQDRNGGRVFTHRYKDGRYAEMGAMRYGPNHVHAHHLFDKYKLKTRPFPLAKKEAFINGVYGNLDELSLEDFGFKVDRSAGQLLEDTMEPVFLRLSADQDDEPEAWAEFIHEFDHYSIRDWFVEQQLSDAEVAALALLNNIEGRMAFSFAEWAQYIREDAFGANLTYLEKGAESLPDRMAEGLDIAYGARVLSADQTHSKAIVEVERAGQIETLDVDAVIMTPPPIVMRRIQIPGIDPPKRQAMRAAYSGRAAKVFLQFSNRWWEDTIGTKGGMCVTDLPSRNIVFTVAGQGAGDRGQIIGSYTWESDAMVLAPLPPERRVQEVLNDVAAIYPEARESFEVGHAYDWGSAEFSGGVGGLFAPHEMTSSHYRKLLQPVGRIWFAGETYDRRSRRWIEAAIRSAVKNVYALTQGMDAIPWLD